MQMMPPSLPLRNSAEKIINSSQINFGVQIDYIGSLMENEMKKFRAIE
jgi:hypothetical protein